MAYALSAAMAVTVVPTYMMKPLVAEAAVVTPTGLDAAKEKAYITQATTKTDSFAVAYYSTDSLSGVVNTINEGAQTVKLNLDVIRTKIGASTPTDDEYSIVISKAEIDEAIEATKDTANAGKIYIATATTEAGLSDAILDAGTAATTKEYYTVEDNDLTAGASVTFTPSKDSLSLTPTVTDGKMYVEANDIDTAVSSALTSNGDTYSVKYSIASGTAKTLGTATATFNPTGIYAEDSTTAKSTFTNGEKITIDSTGLTKTGVVGLFSKTGTLKKADAKYLFDANSEGLEFAKVSNNISFYIPDTVDAGDYYVGIFDADKIGDVTKNDVTGIIDADDLIAVKSADIATGISLTSEKSTISFGDNGAITNTEKLVSTLKGGTKYRKVNYKFTEYTKNSEVAQSNLFTVSANGGTSDLATYSVTDSKELPTFNVKANTGVKDGDYVVCEVEMYVAGRVNPYKRTFTFTAKEDITLVTDITFSNEEYILKGETTTVTTNKFPASSNETLKYKISGTGLTLTDKTVGSLHSLYDSKKVLYATFDEATGEFVNKIPGVYTIEAKGTNKTKTTTITALDFKFNTAGMVVESLNNSIGNGVQSNDLGSTKGYVTYTVEDPSIATINNSTVAYGTALSANALSTGITKVTADITVYGTTKTYNFSKDGYIVVAPKSSDKDFELTSVANTEKYINGLKDTNNFYAGLKLQAAAAILDGAVDASKLSFDAYEDINNAATTEYSGYYDIYNSSVVGNEAIGLVLAAADPDVLNKEDPSKPVTVRYTVSDLQEKDKVYKQKDSVVDFVSEMTVDGEVTELKQPIWLKVTDPAFEKDSVYTVYDDGKAIYTAKCTTEDELVFQTDSFSVFSIVETPDATVTDNTSKVEDPDEVDIYDLINVTGHVQDIGDMESEVSDDGIISIGTHGKSKRLEKITIEGLDENDIVMTGHVQDIGDVEQDINEETGAISVGTDHKSKRLEAFSLALKGDLAEKYDVYYRVHVQDYGWLDWAKNGEVAGTSGHSFRLEAVEIMFVEKGTEIDKEALKKTYEEGNRGKDDKAAYMDRVVASK